MLIMIKKLLYMETKTVCINIFKVACFPMMVKNLKMISNHPTNLKIKKDLNNFCRKIPVSHYVKFTLQQNTYCNIYATGKYLFHILTTKYLCS